MRPSLDNSRTEDQYVRLPNIAKVDSSPAVELASKPKALSIAGLEIKHILPIKRSSATAVTSASQDRESLKVVYLPNDVRLNIRTINVRK